ncbi:MAG: 1,2-diacylglycerol 3-glucosyltransferase [Bacillales bacterium]|nr:1,2-diacylglycerol 3-glucosyltransferase [Bacillales bacterium]
MSKVTKNKILILSGTFGQGHLQAAKALKEAVQLSCPNVQPVVFDFIAWAHPHMYPISNYIYIKGLKVFPQLYGFFYEKTHLKSAFSTRIQSLFFVGLRKMIQLLEREKPAVVVSTHPFVSGILSKLKEYGLTNIPFVTVITDHTDHSSWIHPFTDLYIVGSNEGKNKLLRRNIPEEKIASTGIPIQTKFLYPYRREECIAKHGLDAELFTILIMGGGDGLFGKGFLNLPTLESIPETLQLIILCGRNQKLKQKLEVELKSSKHRIHLFSYVEYVHELMAVSDIIITKPGGVTTSEALAMELPMILYHPLPGQEQENARYLTKFGAAILSEDPDDLIFQLTNLIKNEPILLKMKKNSEKIQKKAAAFDAVSAIYQLIAMTNHPSYIMENGSRVKKWKAARLLKKRTSVLHIHG